MGWVLLIVVGGLVVFVAIMVATGRRDRRGMLVVSVVSAVAALVVLAVALVLIG